ncbi:MAG: DUF4382 domain-containing protein [Cyclobacteriaceae bacterium]|nr:DUF4382 domain-containing protein [Cyclobacteriaceae bacterium]
MRKRNFLAGLFVLLLMAACSENDSTTTSFVVRLTDSPGDYEQVNIDIQSVEVHANTGNQTDGWVQLPTNAGVYDLLKLTNGAETVLVDANFPTGMVSQLRLHLGENNSVVVDGVSYPLFTTSGDESGLKLLINAELIEGITYSVLLDFDAARSVINTNTSSNTTQAGNYVLKPVIRTITEAQDGGIKGIVNPIDQNVAVYAISGLDTLSTSYATAGNNNFFLGGLADGTYTVTFDPGDLSGYTTTSIEGVEVTVGSVADVGETVLIQ